MKTILLLSLAVSALAAGCGDNASQPAPPANATNTTSSSVLTAPVDYLGALGKAQQSAVKTVDTAEINQAIQAFQADHARFPKDLNELLEDKYLVKIPKPPYGMKFAYDPATGQVTVVKQ
jgi:hypothetical protein